jgi:hypothetical protein
LVEELLPGDELVMNFSGDLVRVANETQRKLALGDRLEVIVVATDPLRFRVAIDQRRWRGSGHIDVSA